MIFLMQTQDSEDFRNFVGNFKNFSTGVVFWRRLTSSSFRPSVIEDKSNGYWAQHDKNGPKNDILCKSTSALIKLSDVGPKLEAGVQIVGREQMLKMTKHTLESCETVERKARSGPWMSNGDRDKFRGFLNEAQKKWPCMTYVEWGSGGSTFWALEYARRVVSIENYFEWCNTVLQDPEIQCSILKGQLVYVCVNGGPTQSLGYPADLSNYRQDLYLKALESFDIEPDLVLIDGRFRVASALSSMRWSKTNSTLVIHDYSRQHYHYIEKFFDKIPTQVFEKRVLIGFTKKTNFLQSDYDFYLHKYSRDPR